jgi:type IV secretion system protein TrbI
MTDISEDMAPEASPGTVSGKTGVRKANNMPMYIILAVAATFLITMAMVARDRAAKQNTPAAAKKKAGSAVVYADAVTAGYTGGMVAPAEPEPKAKPEKQLHAPNQAQATVPAAPASPRLPPAEAAESQEEAKLLTMRLQMLEAAMQSRTGVQIQPASGNAMPSSPLDPNSTPSNRSEMIARIAAVRRLAAQQTGTGNVSALYQKDLAKIKSGLGVGAGEGGDVTPAAAHTSGYDQFAGGSGGNRWQMNTTVQDPQSPFELRAGFVIPALLVSGINSQLPGQIAAQTAQDVYDTATGRYLLIPQGSRLVGSYSSDVVYGQSRVLVGWQRIIFPDGRTLDIGSMPGADGAGNSGFKDKVNNHYIRIFGSALLMSGVIAGVDLSQRKSTNSNTNYESTSDIMSASLGQELGQVMAQMISKNLSISPTLEIRPGYRFNVVVVKDLVLRKPYREFDY